MIEDERVGWLRVSREGHLISEKSSGFRKSNGLVAVAKSRVGKGRIDGGRRDAVSSLHSIVGDTLHTTQKVTLPSTTGAANDHRCNGHESCDLLPKRSHAQVEAPLIIFVVMLCTTIVRLWRDTYYRNDPVKYDLNRSTRLWKPPLTCLPPPPR